MNEYNGRSGASVIVKKYDYFIIFLLSFLYIRWGLLWWGNGVGVALFVVLFCTFVTLRLGPVPPERKKAARPWLLVIAASAFQSIIFDYTDISWFNFIFLSICAMYWMMILSGRRILEDITNYLPMDLFCQLIRVPFGNFGRFFGALFRTRRYREAMANAATAESEKPQEEWATAAAQTVAAASERIAAGRSDTPSQNFSAAGWAAAATSAATAEKRAAASARRTNLLNSVLLIVFTLIVAGPLLMVVLNLLAAADEQFMNVIVNAIDYVFEGLDDLISVHMIEVCWDLMLAVPVAAYLFGALWGNVRPAVAKGWTKRERVDRGISALHFAPPITIYTALSLFIAVYLLFLGVQASHLLSALNLGLPQTTTYSEFARQGFFELCTVAAINLGIMAGAWALAARKEGRMSKTLRVMMIVLSLQTVLLVITAMVKMGMYIQMYGLTRLRVYTFWFMIWLLVVFLILAASQVKKLPAAKLLTVLSVVMFLILGYANVDGIIVRENVMRYNDGKMSLEELDVFSLSAMSADAAVELLDYYEENQGEVSTERQAQLMEEIHWVGRIHYERGDDMPWYYMNWNTWREKRRLEALYSQRIHNTVD